MVSYLDLLLESKSVSGIRQRVVRRSAAKVLHSASISPNPTLGKEPYHGISETLELVAGSV